MTGKLRVTLRYAGYGFLTLFLTLYFMFLTFPFSEISDRILPRLEAGLPFRITVEEIRSTPLLWLELVDLQAFPKTGERKRLLEVPELKVRPALLDLLIGRQTFKIRADLLEGTLKGKIARRKGDLDLGFSWNGIRPGKHPLLSMGENMQMEAALSGDLDMHMQGNNWITSDGTLSLDLAEGSIQGLEVYGFTLPEIQGIRGSGRVTVEKRKAVVESLTLTSDQLTVSLDGNIDLSPRFTSSRLALKGKLKLSGPLQTQYQPMLANFLRNKDTDGSFIFSLRGTLGTPRFSG